jgi:hypothetical protein
MNMRTDIWKGIAAVSIMLLMGMNAQAQCPNTSVAFPQSGTACGSFLTYSVTNDVGFASVEWTLDGEFLSDQPSGSLFLPDEGTYAFVVTAMDMNGCESVFEQNVDVGYVFPMVLVCSVLQYPCGGEPVGVIEATFLGGAPPYTYQWVNSQGEVFFGVNLQDIEPDDYTFTFIDSDGCQVQQTVVLSEASS